MMQSSHYIITWFEQQVFCKGEQVAMRHQKNSYTYSELNRRANQIAHYLQALGVGKDKIVAIALPRSPEMLITIIGILKAGAAYLALDLKYPQQRLRYLIQDSNAVALVTNSTESLHFTDYIGQIIDINNVCITTQPAENINTNITGGQLAYIIYTSGSTGLPKGVMIEHAALSNYIEFAVNTYNVYAHKNITILHSSIAFDLTITSLYVPLLRGEEIYLMDEDATIGDLADAIHNHSDMQLLKVTPSHLRALNSCLNFSVLRDFTLIVGGEELLKNDIAPWLDIEGIHIYNEYGPTETTVGCIIYHLSKEDLKLPSIPIGRPIPNTHIYLLDHDQQPVSQGKIGEIYITGAGLARGYFNRGDLTNDKFLPNPFCSMQEHEQGGMTRCIVLAI